MGELFNPISILLHCFNAALLFAALYFLLYKPVRKFIEKRSQQIQAQIDDAENKQQHAAGLVLQGEQALVAADEKAQGVIHESAVIAQQRAEDIIEAAQQEAEHIMQSAKTEAKRLLSNAHDEMADQAAQLSVDIAHTILQREISATDHQLLVESFLKKVKVDA